MWELLLRNAVTEENFLFSQGAAGSGRQIGWNCNRQRLSYARIFRALLLGKKELFLEKQVKITGFKVLCAGSFSW